ncbi:MAG TPA: protein kinase [Bryobacteraceae bacterium]
MDEPGAEAAAEFLPEEWEQVKELVYEYQQQPPDNRTGWLDANCPPGKVRHEVERLLQAAFSCGDFLERPAASEHFGIPHQKPERIGRYRVLEQIGSGGMGVVYAAFDDELNRRVAIKVLSAQSADDPEQQKRLRWDAQAASALQHANIVTVHEVGSDGGVDYVVMECIPGQTLSEFIPAGGMETAEALRCAVQIASGLEAAHKAQVVHRDLKPGNIMITDAGVVKLLDFGLAKNSAVGLKLGEMPPTVEGKFAGTVAYVSPEQAEGKAVDARSDIFSFGSVLFEMLTGRRAFPGESTVTVLADILYHDPPPLLELKPQLDGRLDDILQRCLRKKRERRFQSIAEVRLRLLEIEEEIQYASQDRTTRQVPVARQRAGGLWLGVLVGSAATAVVALGLSWMTQAPERPFALRSATNELGLSEFPSISQDGKMLAYASDRNGNGNLDIYVQQVGGSDPLQLTANPADDYEPVFSPDGTQVAYRSDRDGGGIYISSSLGGSERLLALEGRGAHFSPDGKWLAYWTGQVGGGLYPGSANIWIMPASGGPARQFRPDFATAAYPVWAPEGERLLFLGRGTEAGAHETKVDWWVADVTGTWAHATGLVRRLNEAGLHTPPMNYWPQPEQWLAGSHLVLFSAGHVDATNVWAMGLSDEGIASGVPQRWTAGTMLELHPSAASSAGRLSLAFTALTRSVGIWRVPLDGQGGAAGKPESLVSGFDGISSPSVSADGSRLVFASHRIGGQYIRMKDLKTGTISVITGVRATRVARPVLSGDGSTVAYCDGAGGYVVHVPNGVPERICESCGPPTHISNDGRDVLFESARAPELLLISSDRKPPRPLIQMQQPGTRAQFAGRFSPDGRWVAFAGSDLRTRASHIWIAPVRKTDSVREDELVPLTDGSSSNREPYWSTDGRRVYFLSDRDGFRCVWARAVDPETAHPRESAIHVTDFHHARQVIEGATAYSGDIGLSAAANFLVFSLAEYTGNIWLKTDSARSR